MAQTLTPKEIALEWGTTARTVRKFLRRHTVAQGGTVGPNDTDAPSTPGKGGRYALAAREVKGLKRHFDAWVAANAAKAEESDTEDDSTESPDAPDEA